MKPHPRIRKTIKWGGAAVTVLLVVVWIGSGWYSIQWNDLRGDVLGLSAGRLSVCQRLATMSLMEFSPIDCLNANSIGGIDGKASSFGGN